MRKAEIEQLAGEKSLAKKELVDKKLKLREIQNADILNKQESRKTQNSILHGSADFGEKSLLSKFFGEKVSQAHENAKRRDLINNVITERFFKDGGAKAGVIAKEQEIIARTQAERKAKFELDQDTKASNLKAKEKAVK